MIPARLFRIWTLAVALLLCSGGTLLSALGGEPIDLGNRLELFVDDYLIG